MYIQWYTWVCAGILLLLAELLTPGSFYLLFVGIAAIAVGACEPLIRTAWIELLLFAALSAVFIAFFRKPLVSRIKKSAPEGEYQEFVGKTARALDTIVSGGEGAIEFRGSPWRARNDGAEAIAANSMCLITAREGLHLVVTLQKEAKEGI
jgi:membrane protein implicated in regulation of membrane protease activity